MQHGSLVGWVLIGTGLLDAVIAFAVVGPRLQEDKRGPVTAALLLAAAGMVGLGACLLLGLLGPA